VRFLVDNQLPVALARFLTGAGSESLPVIDEGLSQAADSEILRYAAEGEFVLVSKDDDFFHRATQPGAPVPLVWIRLGNCRNTALLAAIEATWSRVLSCLQAGERVVEVR
jgi:predicted nuclease of predicted toxin-antitoxin system